MSSSLSGIANCTTWHWTPNGTHMQYSAAELQFALCADFVHNFLSPSTLTTRMTTMKHWLDNKSILAHTASELRWAGEMKSPPLPPPPPFNPAGTSSAVHHCGRIWYLSSSLQQQPMILIPILRPSFTPPVNHYVWILVRCEYAGISVCSLPTLDGGEVGSTFRSITHHPWPRQTSAWQIECYEKYIFRFVIPVWLSYPIMDAYRNFSTRYWVLCGAINLHNVYQSVSCIHW